MCSERVVLLPGMGVDARLFDPLRPALPRLEVPAWIPPRAAESLSSYAARLAATVPVADGERFFLGGTSLGGMIAYEMARTLRPGGLLLIASCRDGRQIAASARWVEYFARRLPNRLVHGGRPLGLYFIRDMRRMRPEAARLFREMARDSDVSFLRWAARAALAWRPEPLHGIPIFQIHGERDRLIPLRRTAPSEVVADVGHLLTLCCPGRVGDFIARSLATCGAAQG